MFLLSVAALFVVGKIMRNFSYFCLSGGLIPGGGILSFFLHT